ncbi:natriuretic peptides A-like [Rhinophrynus dorsalis]
MEWKVYLFCWALALVTLQLHGSGAHPIQDMDSEREMDSFKGVLERLEEKLSLIEALESRADAQESNAQDGAQLISPEDSNVLQPESRVMPNSKYPISDSFLKGLRSLQSPKMMRGSGCFGRRIDRIDSLSGLGCNGSRRI